MTIGVKTDSFQNILVPGLPSFTLMAAALKPHKLYIYIYYFFVKPDVLQYDLR